MVHWVAGYNRVSDAASSGVGVRAGYNRSPLMHLALGWI